MYLVVLVRSSDTFYVKKLSIYLTNNKFDNKEEKKMDHGGKLIKEHFFTLNQQMTGQKKGYIVLYEGGKMSYPTNEAA